MEGEADFLLALEELEALRNAHRLKPGGLILVNDFRILPATVLPARPPIPRHRRAACRYGQVCRIPATQIARELGNVRMSNIVMLGVLSRHLDLPEDIWPEVIRENCPPKYVEQNLQAFAEGRGLDADAII